MSDVTVRRKCRKRGHKWVDWWGPREQVCARWGCAAEQLNPEYRLRFREHLLDLVNQDRPGRGLDTAANQE